MLHDIKDQYDEVGQVEQLHGVHGEVEIVLNQGIEAAGQLTENTLVYLQLKSGDIIPARVSKRRIADKPDHESLYILFDHSKSREIAADLVGAYVLLEKQKWQPGLPEDKDASAATETHTVTDINKLIELDAVDTEGTVIGKVIDAEEFPAQSMLLVELNRRFFSSDDAGEKEEDQQIMVPLVDEYVADIDEANRKIVLKNIDRLILSDDE